MRTLDYPVVTLNELTRLPAADVIVLTVNNRLARTLTTELAAEIGAGSTELVAIQPWSSWLSQQVLERQYDSQTDSYDQVLTAQASRLLWADVIDTLEAGRSLVDVDQLASLAADADALLLNWHIDVPLAWHTPDFSRFLVWRAAYEDRLRALNVVDAPRLSRPVGRWIADGQIALPPHVILLGFTELSAAMRALLDQIQAAGAQIGQLTLAIPNATPQLSQCGAATPEAQWALALQWARDKLDRHAQGRFAIVVPALQRDATEARRRLQTQLNGHAFNVAVAPPLAQWGLARAMLAWLRVVVAFARQGHIEPEFGAQALLAGGCVASQREAGARALIDARWRQQGLLTITTDQWDQALSRLPELSVAWQQAQAVWQSWPRSTSRWFDWANRFRTVLAALGFPGEGSQSSVQYQTTAAIDQLITTLAGLDDLLPAPSLHEAWQMLSRLAQQTLFQPQRDRSARLDVLGLLEAEGGRWDGVWVMGVTDDVLPAMVRPNPLIPVVALARAGAPRSTAQREYQWAQELTHALGQSAPEVVFSWAERDGEQPQRASPLISGLPSRAVQASVTSVNLDPVAWSEWDDEPSIALREDEVIGGGVGVLQMQATNPKWAFFRHRLGARGLPPYARSPRLAERGTLLHEVMRVLWDRWGAQAQMLKHVNEPGWATELATCVERTAARTLSQWPKVLRELEIQRAVDLLNGWLAIEAQRGPFKVIERESTYRFERAGLTLNVALDRIDELPQGELVVIDYKTGANLPNYAKDWQHRLLGDLQLLVYASVLHTQGRAPCALVWAHLYPGQLALAGLADESVELDQTKAWDSLPEARASWTAQLAYWDGQIGALAQGFAQGHNRNCFWRAIDARYCDISALLGLHFDPDDEVEVSDD